jgi:hypothetical protein
MKSVLGCSLLFSVLLVLGSCGSDPPSTGDGGGTNPFGNANTGGCGNGTIDLNEQCDGQNLGGSDCTQHGYSGGTLLCDPNTCAFDTQMCTGSQSTGGQGG